MVLTDFVLSNNLVEEAKRVNRRRSVCGGEKWRKFGTQSSTTKGNNSPATTTRPISIKDEEKKESGVNRSDKEKEEETPRGGTTSCL